jgi:hypothetical protein
MFTTVSAQLPTHTLLELLEQLKRCGGTQDLSEAITTAVEFWLADQKQFPGAVDPHGLNGYQWKCLFLPEGTVLCSWSYGDHNYARVEGGQIIHRGKPVSPNEFARAFARTNRNAWLDVRIRRPGDKHFKQASLLRKEILREQDDARKARIDAAVPAPAAQPSPPPSPQLRPLVSPPSIVQPSQPTALRDPTPGEGWTLPERRKWRFRFEDIAFE